MADLSIKLKTYADLTTFQQSINDISSKVKPIDIKISSTLDQSLLNIDSALGPVSSKITSTYERLSLMRAEGSLSAKSFETLSTATHMVQDALSKGNISFSEANKQLNEITNNANGASTSLLQTTKSIINLKTGVSGLSGKGAEESGEFFSSIGPVTSRIGNLSQKLNEMSIEGSISNKTFGELSLKVNDVKTKLAAGNITFDQANKQLTNIENSANGVKKGFFGMSQPLSDIIKKFGTWYIVAGLVTSAIGALKSIVSTTIELDKAFTSIQMVTGYNETQINELKQTYIDLAQEMGVTVETVTNGADEWLRAGLSVAETNDALKASLVLSTVAQMDSAESTKYLVAAMNGFKLEASELIDLVDKLSAIDVVAATSSEELGVALSYSANSAQLAGIGLDKYLGMIATISETTRQSATTIGNSFRSMFTRLQKVKIGALFDEEGESISDVDSVLQQYGINLMESSDNLTDMGKLLDTLNDKWGEFTTAEKSQIATTIAGNYQRERFLVLMENYDRALELEQVSLESSGSAMDKYAIYQESLEANINSLNSAWVDFVNSLNASGFIDFIISGTKGLLDFISGIIQGIESLGWFGDVLKVLIPIIIAATAAFLAFKGIITGGAALVTGLASLTAVAIAIASFSGSVNELTEELEDEENQIDDTTESMLEYNDALENVKYSLTSITESLESNIEAIKEQNEELKNQKDLEEKLFDLAKARQAFEEAKNKKVKIFRAGVGFTYEADTSEVQSAQENLTEAITSLAETKYDIAVDRAEQFIEELNTLLTSGDIITGWDELFTDFSDLLETEFADYLLDAKNFVDNFNDVVGETGINIETNYGDIDHNASGSMNYGGGITEVGEKGPEIVRLPAGSEILNNSKTTKLHNIVDNPSKYIKGSNSNNQQLVFNGPLNFPNVTNANDANGFIKQIIALGNKSIPKLN